MQLGPPRARLATDLDPVAVGQEQIHHRHIGTGTVDTAERFGHGRGLSHHLEVLTCIDHRAQTVTHDLVVVDQEHADLSSRRRGRVLGTATPNVIEKWGGGRVGEHDVEAKHSPSTD